MADQPAIPASAIPRAALPVFQHAIDIYASETNKVASVWRQFSGVDLAYLDEHDPIQQERKR